MWWRMTVGSRAVAPPLRGDVHRIVRSPALSSSRTISAPNRKLSIRKLLLILSMDLPVVEISQRGYHLPHQPLSFSGFKSVSPLPSFSCLIIPHGSRHGWPCMCLTVNHRVRFEAVHGHCCLLCLIENFHYRVFGDDILLKKFFLMFIYF